MLETVKEHFSKSKVAFEQEHYNQDTIQKLYREQFTNMSPELVEKVKEELYGHISGRREALLKIIGRTITVNELLHVMHSYVQNDNDLLVSLPVLEAKDNEYKETITLYGEETEIAKKLFEGFPEELDVGVTDIVSVKDKILMMVRDRGHALTIDVDIRNPDEIAVTYFMPKICNEEMVRALPGINTSSISVNGATGFFLTSIDEMIDTLTDFIEKVPVDDDEPQYRIGEDGRKIRLPIFRIEKGMVCRINPDGTKVKLFRAKDKEYIVSGGNVYEITPEGNWILIEAPEESVVFAPDEPQEQNTPDVNLKKTENVFCEMDAQELAIQSGERGPRTGEMEDLYNKLKKAVVRTGEEHDRENK